jgi:hypothetical protein
MVAGFSIVSQISVLEVCIHKTDNSSLRFSPRLVLKMLYSHVFGSQGLKCVYERAYFSTSAFSYILHWNQI